MKANKTASEQTWAESFVGAWNFVLLWVIILVGIADVAYEHNSAERIAHHEVSMARIKQQDLLVENQKLLGAMAELVRSYSSQRQSSMAGMESNAVQETAGLNPDAIDSVPCCGDPTQLPPLLEMAMRRTSGNAETELVERLPEDAPVEGSVEHELEKIIEQMPEETRVKMQYYLYQMKAFEAGLGESDLAELEKMKADVREQFKEQEAMLMQADEGMEFSAEELEARKELMEKTVHFRAVSRLMIRKREIAIKKKIQEASETVRQAIYTPEELEQQEAIQAFTDLAFPE